MSAELELTLASARAALHGEAAEAMRARAVSLARARTLKGAAPPRAPNPLARVGIVLAFAAFALVSTLFFRSWQRERSLAAAPRPIVFNVNGLEGVLGERVAAIGGRDLAFDDGTRVQMEAGSALRVIALDARGGRLLLEQGTLRASFRHRQQTYWTVEAGGLVVEVTGTRFEVSFDQGTQAFSLRMSEGSVRVHGCGIEGARVVQGIETIQARCAPALTPADLPAVASSTVSPGLSVVASPDALADAPRSHAVGRRVVGAPAEPVKVTPPAADESLVLLQRADGERRAGDVHAARLTLLELRQRFPRGAGAAQAAFDLGVLAFDVDGRLSDAARWFRRYLDEAPRGPLAREALGRVLEVESRTDDPAALTTAARYLESYPGGPHASLAKRLAAQRP